MEMKRTSMAITRSLAVASLGLSLLSAGLPVGASADSTTGQDLQNSAHNAENATKKETQRAKKGGKHAGQEAGKAGRDVGRKTKKSAHDVGNDIKNG